MRKAAEDISEGGQAIAQFYHLFITLLISNLHLTLVHIKQIYKMYRLMVYIQCSPSKTPLPYPDQCQVFTATILAILTEKTTLQ